MLSSAIRELAGSPGSTWIAAAAFESTVQIWDVRAEKKISEFPTKFCFGADNLALAPVSGTLIAGRSSADGSIAAYEVVSGRRIWERQVSYPRSLRFHPSGHSFLCTTDSKSVIRLDVKTGGVLETFDETTRCIEDEFGNALIVPAKKGKPFRLLVRGQTFCISRQSFAVLDAKFSPDSICVSEAGGVVSCTNLANGKLRWMFVPDEGSHVLNLHYCRKLDSFFGIHCDFQEGSFRYLIRFDMTTGAAERVCRLESWEEVFLDSTDQLVTSAGEIRDLAHGALVGRLDFPLRDYPDE